MPKATDELLKDHKMIRKALSGFRLDNPRFPEILKTLQRIVIAHAWFEDTIFLPALNVEPKLKRLDDEISQEHKDIDHWLKALRNEPKENKKELEIYSLQLMTTLEAHFRKEEDALFPLAERILNLEGLNKLGDEMRRRQSETRTITDAL